MFPPCCVLSEIKTFNILNLFDDASDQLNTTFKKNLFDSVSDQLNTTFKKKLV